MKTSSLLLPLLVLSAGCGDAKKPAIGVHHVSFSPKGTWLVAAGGRVGGNQPLKGGNGIVKAWDTAGWKPVIASEGGFTDPVEAIYFISDDSFAVTSNNMIREKKFGSPLDGTHLRAWSLVEPKELPPVHVKGAHARGVDFYPPKKLVAQGAAIATLPDWQNMIRLEKHTSAALHLKFSPDGKSILSCTDGRDHPPALRLHDTANGKQVAEHKLDDSKAWCAGFSPNGKMIGVAAENDKLYVFTADLKSVLLKVDCEIPPRFVAFTPDNEMTAIRKDRNTIQLYSIKTKELAKSFDANPDGANCCCFSPNGKLIAIGGGGQPEKSGKLSPGKVRVFEVKTGKLVATLD